MHVLENTLVQVEDDLTIHRRDLVLYCVYFALGAVKGLAKVTQVFLVLGAQVLLTVFVVLLLQEGWA
jgi:hypothetical protein